MTEPQTPMYDERFVPAVAPRPDERPLNPVRRFLNSVLLETRIDELATPETAARWFAAQGYEPVRLTPRELAEYRRVRDLLRDYIRGNGDGQALRRVLEERLHAHPAVDFGAGLPSGGLILDDVKPAWRPLQRILAAVWRGSITTELARLKVCADDRCQIAFYDRSRNRSREWCTSGECGNRNRVARHRAKLRERRDPS